ncbi:tripartite tricarboxylate transporter TctB family protein [Shimia sediminis]|uniref:tripartite tricarboxylate transporter TctB family protein n=1 Tax=Shimia sediminis TaxID=2497945 RepID=UPI00197FA340|nr:tripartite tricarboxylate transporter TctB family protein [Shimia sediminis]
MSLLLIALSLVGLWVSKSELRSGGTPFASGEAMLPELALCLILGLSILNLVRGLMARADKAKTMDVGAEIDVAIAAPQIAAILFVCGLMVAYSLAFTVIGYIPASIVLLAVLMASAGGRNKMAISLVSVLVAIVLYLGLRYGLGVHAKAFPEFLALKG